MMGLETFLRSACSGMTYEFSFEGARKHLADGAPAVPAGRAEVGQGQRLFAAIRPPSSLFLVLAATVVFCPWLEGAR